MDLYEYCPEKIRTAEKAVSNIKSGSRVFIGTGCGEPQCLIKAMVNDKSLQDIMVYQMLSSTFSQFIEDESFLRRFSLKLFFISSSMRKAAFEGKIDYIPTYLSQIPRLFYSGQIGLDIALVQVSPPDRFGYCSLGVSVDITRAGMYNAKLVIAQVNPKMPNTRGDSSVHVDEIDYFVLHEEPLVESLPSIKDNEIAKRIGHYVSQLVDDGVTLQIGFGHLPNAILQHLDNKKNLGIHTQLITDSFIPLIEKKIITNKKKTLIPGRIVASLCMGSEKLYNYVDNNPIFYFRSSEYVNDPTIIARNDNLISISSALEVDLTGQVCTDSMGHLFYSGIGDQVDFLRGSAMSKGGFAIIALPSTAQNGEVSRIVPHLSEGAGVATTRGDVSFIVTEYGIAELQGKGIYQRVMELAQIAHPKFREELIKVARKRHYIFSDQLPPSQDDLLFLENYKSTLRLRNGKIAEFRPLFPSDEFAYRNFFYSLQEKTIYYRFFYRIKLFSHEVVQKQWASVDYRKNMSIIALIQNRGHKEIIAIGSYMMESDDRAEVAFVVREDYQSMGIASYLIKVLENIAKENNYKEFSATVLRENWTMIHVFRKRYPNAETSLINGSEITLFMDFDDAIEPPEPKTDE
ncbi:bifunctional acetyl-CoA hydrolase/transferase family protein/GNAT family N-acetyltransferase [Desulfonema magnum]|uniref:Acetyl-CoA hydrolase/transferase n=1 Tax=Desulfonema magnum TaxID=45655 RepID=A0A975GR93_9BACT|nr:bifunctional acetyl-CoA hydrolase/transferase family protein/GNAT family N-acetyltransferase [Desulfonema magnum]QTA89803.1 Acetyl-CoA hydrolase/transferase [Desulfonema magnum]